MTIVVLASNPAALESIGSLFGPDRRTVPITVITPLNTDGLGALAEVESVTLLTVEALRERAIDRAAARSVVGRTLLRLTPADRGARLRRAVRRSASARAALDQAQTLVAADRDAILTIWSAGRRSPHEPVSVVGVPALAAIIRRSAAAIA